MAAPTIPASSTQAVQTTGGGTTPFTMQWWNFFNGLQVGVTDGSNAAAGNIGQYISSIVPFGSGLSMTSNTIAQFATVSLTAGDWDLSGEVYYAIPNTASTNFYSGWLSNSNALSTPGASAPGEGFDYGQSVVTPTSGGGVASPYTITGLRTRVNISATAPYYLMGYLVFTGTGTITGYGAVRARRMR